MNEDGRQVELFGRVYEWTLVAGRWTLALVLVDKRLMLMEELQRHLNGTGELSTCDTVEDAIRHTQELLEEL